MSGIFGIDLGTTHSVVAYIDENGRPAVVRNSDGGDATPSVVFFESESSSVVGMAARASAGLFPNQVVSLIKQEMGDRDYTRTFFGRDYTPSAISALILAVLARDAEEVTGHTVREVVIAVPAYFGLLEKDATRKAGEIAGLEVIGIIPEPVAAALAYGVTGSVDGTTFLVYDLGGRTFDVTLIKMTDTSVEVLAVDGDHRLGGADWDSRLFDYFEDQVIEQAGDESIEDDEGSLLELLLLAEEAKKALTNAETRKAIYRYNGIATSITVTRAQFEEMTADLLEETVRITHRMLGDAGQRYPGIRGQVSGLLLVGGSSRMPAVAERLRQEFPWEPKIARPDLAVAKGAALYAASPILNVVETVTGDGGGATGTAVGAGRPGTLPSGPVSADAIAAVAARTGLEAEKVEKLAGKAIVNVLPKGIGIKLLDTDNPRWQGLPEDEVAYVEHLVPPQTLLPYRAEKFTAHTTVPNQESIAIELWERPARSPIPRWRRTTGSTTEA